jgi:hypothetical protein
MERFTLCPLCRSCVFKRGINDDDDDDDDDDDKLYGPSHSW